MLLKAYDEYFCYDLTAEKFFYRSDHFYYKFQVEQLSHWHMEKLLAERLIIFLRFACQYWTLRSLLLLCLVK